MRSSSDWNECIRNTDARTGTPDPAKARALLAVARARAAFLNSCPKNDADMIFHFEGHYACALETLHAACLTRGAHVGNHLCLGFFLRDMLHRPDLFRLFDLNRQRRNDLVYYGNLADPGVANTGIEELTRLRTALEGIALV